VTFSDDLLFLVIDHDFQIFPIFLTIVHIFAVCYVIYDPIITRKKTLFHKIIPLWHCLLLCSCFRAHPRQTTSQNIGREGRMHGPSPNLKFWGTVPHSPRSPPQVLRERKSLQR